MRVFDFAGIQHMDFLGVIPFSRFERNLIRLTTDYKYFPVSGNHSMS